MTAPRLLLLDNVDSFTFMLADYLRVAGAEVIVERNAIEVARALEAAGVAFVGPPASAVEAMGDKIASKRLAAEAGVSTVPGFAGVVEDARQRGLGE